ncbi:MAG: hypothetical protein Fur0046_39560 [Cyanobacteria bacterium J069]|nr:MAG: PTPA-CTERM sorting domain-containing protein [Cyanobacteria bacterium J069]
MKATQFPGLLAIAAAVSVFSALPAEAISVTRGAGPAFKDGLPATGTITFDGPAPGFYPTFSENYGGVEVTGTNLRIREDEDAPGSPFLRLANLPGSTATFSLNSITDSFGFFLVEEGETPDFTINFLLGGSNTRTFLRSDLLGTTGSGNYFSFVSDSNDDFFDQVTFSRTNGFLSIDNVAYRVVPTPALLPGIIGMGIAALKKRRDGALDEVEAEAEA